MAQINYATRELITKIVYYGPGFCGKTTSLYWLYNKLDPHHVERMYSVDTDDDRTLFFDLLPIAFNQIEGINLRVKLYTVPGQVKYDFTRRMTLKGADAVVFVADSEARRYKENIESLKNLGVNLAKHKIDFREIPLVLQYNKRDCSDILPIEVMDEMLNVRQWPSFGSVAIAPDDSGVLNSFIASLALLLKSFGKHLGRTDEEMHQITGELEQDLKHQIKPGWDLKVLELSKNKFPAFNKMTPI